MVREPKSPKFKNSLARLIRGLLISILAWIGGHDALINQATGGGPACVALVCIFASVPEIKDADAVAVEQR